jgi:geranylgeranyl pyrophosphate synthase
MTLVPASSNTATKPITSASIQIGWRESVQEDLGKVTEKIQAVSFLDNPMLDAAINMIIEAGGKRMRPAITMMVGRACGANYDHAISVAASVELLHTATLVHDDLIDKAEERRGAPTLHMQLPLGVTVLTGDFLFAQSAALAAEAGNVRVVQVFSETLVNICKGEILQAQTRWQVPDIQTYIQRIYGKTAALFEAAAISGAILGHQDESVIQAFKTFGHELGLAFQIVDDALDFVSDATKLGKPAGHDVRQGHFNLPIMLYLEDSNIDADTLIEQARHEQGVEDLVAIVREQGFAHETLRIARKHVARAEAALDTIGWSPALEPLLDLAQYAVARDF